MTNRTIHKHCPANPPRAGFTLIELVVVIVIIGVVATMLGTFIRLPVQGYVDLSRRAALVDSAEGALRRMARDIRIALPNSVRAQAVGSGFVLELLPTLDGGRYVTTESVNPCAVLAIGGNDTDFDILGSFSILVPPINSSLAYRLVINNPDATSGGNNAYTGTGGVITPVGTTITITRPATAAACAGDANHDHINLSALFTFSANSPRRRLFVIQSSEAPITYLCDPTTGTLTRYAGYTVSAVQPTTAAALTGLGATAARVADHVNACGVTTTDAQVQSRGLVTLDLSLADQGETVRLIHQVQLDNSQ